MMPTKIHSIPFSHHLKPPSLGEATAATGLGEDEACECVGVVRSEALPLGTVLIVRDGVGDWIGSGETIGASARAGVLLGKGAVVAGVLGSGATDVGMVEGEASGVEEVESTVGGPEDGSAIADPFIKIPNSAAITIKPAHTANFRKGIPPKSQR